MELNDQVKFKIIKDIKEAIFITCKKHNIKPFNLDGNFLADPEKLDENFSQALLESLILKHNSEGDIITTGNIDKYVLTVELDKEKIKFMREVRDEVFKRQYITFSDKQAPLDERKLSVLFGYLYSECANNGIDQLIDSRLDEVLADFFGDVELSDEMIQLMLDCQSVAAQNIKKSANPLNYQAQREKVWSTEIKAMLNNILIGMQIRFKEGTYDTTIINKVSKKLKQPKFFTPIVSKWDAWDKQTREQLDPRFDRLDMSSTILLKKSRKMQSDLKKDVKEFSKKSKKAKKKYDIKLKDALKEAKKIIEEAQLKSEEIHAKIEENNKPYKR